MRRTLAGGLAACAGLLALPVVLLGPQAAEAASSAGRCEQQTGVSVVVDFGPLPGGTEVGCVPEGDGRSAAVVTVDSGHPITYTQRQPFVCRISGQPAAEQEPCNDTPPEDAYWGLFWSDGKRGWTYAGEGATTLEVHDGWSVGWRFQDGGTRDQPSSGPRRDTAPSPSPRPTSSSPRPTASPRPSTSPRTATSAPAPSSVAAVPSAAASSASEPSSPARSRRPGKGARATTPATTEASATESATASASPTGDAAEQADGSFATVTDGDDAEGGGGGGTGLAAAAGLAGLSVLAGSAAVVAHRRGRA